MDAPPLWSLALRFAISGGLAVGVARVLGQSWRLPPAQTRAVVIFGLCQNALYLGLFFVAMQKIEASLASIIASSMPLIVAGLGWGFRGERVAPLGIAGLVAGFAGVALIMGSRLQGGADLMSVGLCVIGATALAVATLSVRGASAGGNLLMVVGLQMLVGSAALAVVALLAIVGLIQPTFQYQAACWGIEWQAQARFEMQAASRWLVAAVGIEIDKLRLQIGCQPQPALLRLVVEIQPR